MTQNMLFLLLWCIHTILESLPISSSGHMVLLTRLLTRFSGLRIPSVSTTLTHLMHIPTLFVIGAYLVHFKLFDLIRAGSYHGISNPVIGNHLLDNKIFNLGTENQLALNLLHWVILIGIANGITFFCYVIKKGFVRPFVPKERGREQNEVTMLSSERITARMSRASAQRESREGYEWPLFIGFIISGLALLSLYLTPIPIRATLTYFDAIIIGLAQALSLFPAASRLALTFVAAIWLGIMPLPAMLFSLTIEFVLILGAVAKALYDVYRKKASFPAVSFFGFIALTFASIIAYLALLWVTQLAISGSIALFGLYLLALSVVVYLVK